MSSVDDEDVRDSVQRTDLKFMRTAAFCNQSLWNTLVERTTLRFDREGTEMCLRTSGRPRTMRIDTHEPENVIAHQTHNKGGNHGIKSPLRVAVITNQCVNRGSTFADRSTAQNHAVNSWSRGTWRRSHSQSVATLASKNLVICQRIARMPA